MSQQIATMPKQIVSGSNQVLWPAQIRVCPPQEMAVRRLIMDAIKAGLFS